MGSQPTGTVTFLFTDIEGSTKLAQEYPDDMSALLARHNEILDQAITVHNGFVFRTVGDAYCAAFHSASAALNAALDAQRGLYREGWAPAPIKVRMGIHTGSAQLHGESDYSGYATLALAQRIMSAGHGGQVLLSQTVHDLVIGSLPEDAQLMDMGERHLKDVLRPEHLYQLTVPDLPSEFLPLKTLQTINHNLPTSLTSFIGRERELSEAKERLANARLLTLIGPGGTGKTRLSLQMGADLLDDYPDGVWLVELAPLADQALIPQTIASVFGLRESPGRPLVELVTDYLRAKHLLIILDNCEHLIEASARLAEGFLKACPGLKIIASSREALGIPGETTYRVPSLFLPEQDKVSREALLGCEAVQLFVERARSANPKFDLTEGNATSVAQICLRLDGIPLALELAAARVRVLAVEQIAERLGDRFRLLTGGSRTAMPRQQTLRALIDWSYDLLTDSEKAMFRRLAVFVGGWTLEAAEAVCSGDGVEIYEVLDLLAQLVDKSLVIAEENDDAVRYHRLETIRQYAREKLLETDEAAIVRDRHLDYFIELARSREKENLASWFGEAAIEGVADDDNIRSALSWALESQPAKAMELAAGSVTFWSWIMRGYIAEIRDWCQTILSRVDSLAPGQVEPTKYILGLKAQTWNRLSQALMNLGDHQASKSAAEKSVELAREANDQQTLAEALGSVGIGALYSGDPESALKATEESIQICIARGYKRELVWAYNTMTHICRVKGDEAQKQIYLDRQKAILHEAGVPLDPAEEELELSERALFNGDIDVAMKHAETGLAILSDRGDKYRLTNFQSHIAHILRQQGRFDEALNFYRGAIRLWQDFGHRGAIAHQLECFGLIALAQEQSTRAAMLFSAAEALRETVDSVRTPAEQKEFKEAKSKLQSQMGGGEFNDLWNEGRSITMEQAIALALEG